MSSNEIIRCSLSARLVRPIWSNRHYDETTRTPTEHCEAIGYVVSTFNGLEVYFRSLVGFIAGLKSRQADAILTHIGNVTLAASLGSLARSVVDDQRVRDELEFCADLFERCRINRNLIVHNSTYRPLVHQGEDFTLLTKRSARGKLKVEHWALPLDAIRTAAEHNINAEEYLANAIGPLSHSEPNKPLSLPHRPLLPDDLAKSHPKGDLSHLAHLPRSPGY